MSNLPHQLDYAPRPPLQNQRRWVIRVLVGLAVIAVGYVAIRYGPPLVQQMRYLSAQQRCMDCQIPPDTVVYANTAEDAPLLGAAATGPVARVTAVNTLANPSGETVASGRLLTELNAVNESTIGSYARTGYGFVRLNVPNAPARTGAFLHVRQNRQGTPKLVAIVFLERQTGFGRVLELNALVWQPATWTLDSRLVLISLTTLQLTDLEHHQVRILSGQLDRGDDSHLTIPYQIDGHPGIVDGYLDQYGQVHLTNRNGSE